jgi:hypothetical protein
MDPVATPFPIQQEYYPAPVEPKRRSFLKWIIIGIAGVPVLIVGILLISNVGRISSEEAVSYLEEIVGPLGDLEANIQYVYSDTLLDLDDVAGLIEDITGELAASRSISEKFIDKSGILYDFGQKSDVFTQTNDIIRHRLDVFSQNLEVLVFFPERDAFSAGTGAAAVKTA